MTVVTPYVVNILKDVVDSMTITANYQPGRVQQILDALIALGYSPISKTDKYPLIAVSTPIFESRGDGFYSEVHIPRIAIATITREEYSVIKRFEPGGTYDAILYPLYFEFLKRLARNKFVVGKDPDMLSHKKADNPGNQPLAKDLNDYVDIIEIIDLKFLIVQQKIC